MDGERECVHVTRFETVLGPVTVASTARGVVACTLPGERREKVARWLARNLPGAEIVHGEGRNGPAVRAVQDYLAGRRLGLDLPLDLRGTEFQCTVWRTLQAVPYGATIRAGELAGRCGRPDAAQACGEANACNPVALFVPSHRLVADEGAPDAAGGSQPANRRLLALEQRGVHGGVMRAG